MMFTTAIKIYLVTNFIFLLLISLYWFTEGFGVFGLIAAPISLIFSAPLILLLAALLWILNLSKLPPVYSWILFALSVAGMTYLPFCWYSDDLFKSNEMKFLIACAYIGAFASVMVYHKTIHRLFLHDRAIKTNVKREAWSN